MTEISLAAMIFALVLQVEQPTGERVYGYHQERPGVSPAAYSLQISADGSGRYWEGPTPAPGQAEVTSTSGAGVRIFHVAPATVQRIAGGVPVVRSGRCETHLHRIAQTGVKTVSVSGPDGEAKCTLNFSDDDRLNATVSAFQALAETQQAGTRLEYKLRFDRLGLDGEMDSFIAELNGGQATDARSIQPVLERLVKDERVMERVRRKASQLLDLSTPVP